MQLVEDLSQLRLEACELTIGSFDGVHLGHQALIRAMVADARKADLPAAVLTFFPHPSVVLRGRQSTLYITSPEEKADLLGELGIDYVVNQRFDHALSVVRAADFLDMLKARLGFQDLWVGEDFALGHHRQGNRLYLEKAGAERGFRLHVIPPLIADDEVISSTRVREALRSGDVARAATYLGRPFVVPGTVVRGPGRGRRLGIPTANLSIWQERAFPGPGVYACLAEVAGRRLKAVTNIGIRPTFDDGEHTPIVEAHLLDYEGDLYGQELRLGFVDRLRDERRFPGPEALVEQIQRDIRRARKILDRRGEAGDV
jgi:riboflavin kinase/FMN adenylyltransferase